MVSRPEEGIVGPDGGLARRVKGTVMVRPIVVAIVIDPAPDTVMRAVQAATACWGGMYFPIFSSSLDEKELTEEAARFGVDAIVHMASDGTTKTSDATGFRYGGNSPYGPFDGEGGMLVRRLQHVGPLISQRIASFSVPGLGMVPSVQPDDGFVPALRDAVRWGAYPDDDLGTSLRHRYFDAARRVPTGLVAGRPEPPGVLTPIGLTGYLLEHTGDSPGTGFAVVDLGDPLDAIAFWNLRAANSRVYCWPTNASPEEVARLSASLRNAPGLPTARTGGAAPREFPFVTVWKRESTLVPDEIQALCDDLGAHVHVSTPEATHLRGGFRPPHFIHTEARARFDQTVDPSDLQLRVEFPNAVPLSSPEEAGRVAAQVSIDSETRWPRDLVAAIPGARSLASAYDAWCNYVGAPLIQPGLEGPIVAADAWFGEVPIPILKTDNVLLALFDGSPWILGRSDAGRFSSQVVELLGGLGTLRANQPALRAVLRKLGRAGHGQPHAALVSEATKFAAEWRIERFSKEPVDEYSEGIVGQLLDTGILVPYLKLGCPFCRNPSEWELGELSEEMTCRLCRRTFRPGVALVLGKRGDKGRWRYGLARHLDPGELMGAMAVVATLEFLEQLAHFSPRSTIQLGVELRRDRRVEGDIDILRLGIYDNAPTAFVCEVKAGASSDIEEQLGMLSDVQAHLRTKQIECIPVVSTLGGAPDGDERQMLREFVERSPARIYGLAHQPCLPLILTSAQVDARPDAYGLFGWTDREVGPIESALRANLGLASIDWAHGDGWNYRWDEDTAV